MGYIITATEMRQYLITDIKNATVPCVLYFREIIMKYMDGWTDEWVGGWMDGFFSDNIILLAV
jgi:hypothetical protein